MPKFHIEVDCRVVETDIYEVEASTLEEAADMALHCRVEPLETKRFLSDEREVDWEASHRMEQDN